MKVLNGARETLLALMTYTITCESRLHQRLANCGRYSGIPLLEHLALASFSETFPARGMILLEVTAGAHHSPPPCQPWIAMRALSILGCIWNFCVLPTDGHSRAWTLAGIPARGFGRGGPTRGEGRER
jgi:hypothetical protein